MLRRIEDEPVPGKRRGRQKTRWKDSCKRDLESMGLNMEKVLGRTKWKREREREIKTIPATTDDGKSLRRRTGTTGCTNIYSEILTLKL